MILTTLKKLLLPLAVLAFLGAPALAADPSGHEIYEALKKGHLQQAQQMIDQVLASHPKSAKAHYIAAEVAARRNNFGTAREELAKAEKLAPGLPFVDARSKAALRAQLNKALPLSAPKSHFATPGAAPLWELPVPESKGILSSVSSMVAAALLLGLLLYFLPTLVAFGRRHPHRWVILLVNFVFGFSVVGWVVALIWAMLSPPSYAT